MTPKNPTSKPSPTEDSTNNGGAKGSPPTNPQDHLLDCLIYVTRFFNKTVSPETLVAGLPLKNGMLTPQLYSRAAKRAGLSARMAERKLSKLSDHVFPTVALLTDGHPIVIVGRSAGNSYRVFDPASKQKEVTVEAAKILKYYSNIVLMARPASEFELEKETIASGQSWFWGVLKQFKAIYIQVGLAAVMINLFALTMPMFIMNVYDRVVPNAAYETLWVLVTGITVVLAFDFILRQLRDYFVDVAGRGADILLSSQIFQQVMNIRLGSRNSSSGAFANQLREFETLRDFFTSATLVSLIDLPFVLLFIGVIGMIGGAVALVPLIALPIVIIVGLSVQVPLKNLVYNAAKDMDAKHSHLLETLTGLEAVKTSNAQSNMQSKWEYLVGVMARLGLKSRFLSSFSINFTLFVQQAVTIGIVVVGVYLINEGDLSVGALVASTILAGRTMAPVGQAMSLFVRFHQSWSSLQTLNEIMHAEVERPDAKNYISLPQYKGGIEFKDVHFSYPDAPVESVRGVNMKIVPGQRVAIVGRTGSGKSTMARLLAGLYLPTEGSVLLDNLETRQLDPAEFRNQMGYVPQQISLFKGTLRENLVMGKPMATDDEILKVCKMTSVDDIAGSHPLGYDLPIGERGEGLSGGQRQAVTVARALLKEPSLLIMDEPSSEMDNRTEAILMESLKKETQGKTLVLITHRASMLALVDRLIIMDQGRIVADGPKDHVLKALQDGKVKGGAV